MKIKKRRVIPMTVGDSKVIPMTVGEYGRKIIPMTVGEYGRKIIPMTNEDFDVPYLENEPSSNGESECPWKLPDNSL